MNHRSRLLLAGFTGFILMTGCQDNSNCERWTSVFKKCDLLSPGWYNCPLGEDEQTSCDISCWEALSCEQLRYSYCEGMPDAALQDCLLQCWGRHGFTCGSDTIDQREVCDGRVDCVDGSDEAGCPTFRCAHSYEEIPEILVCNGHSDCDDNSDEDGCLFFECYGDWIGRIPMDNVCDGHPDCEYGEDEEGCASFCMH